MEACTPAGGVCVMVGWTRMGELTLVSEDILLGKTLKGSYFGGKACMINLNISYDDLL